MLLSFVLASPQPMEIEREQEPSNSELPRFGTSDPLANASEGSSALAPLPHVMRREDFENLSMTERLFETMKYRLLPSRATRRASDRAMAKKMIKARPAHVDIGLDQLTGRTADHSGWTVVQLPTDANLASKDLAIMTERRKSFYAVDKDDRVWLYETRSNQDLFT